jgi:hypothetical protein
MKKRNLYVETSGDDHAARLAVFGLTPKPKAKYFGEGTLAWLRGFDAIYSPQVVRITVYFPVMLRRPGPRKRRALKALRKKKREGLCSCLVGLCWHGAAGDVYHLADCPLWTRRNPRPSWEERQP